MISYINMNLSNSETPISPIITYIIIVWSIILKGLALWRAAKYDQRNWFVAILVLQTLGILEIVYLFRFAKKRFELSELRLQFWKQKK